MISFHGDFLIKQKYLIRVHAHRLSDEIIHGKYWENGKGCAVGCTVHSSSHMAYESELGIPEWLARCEDTIFEGMSNGRALEWPEQFLDAVPIGVDLNQIKAPFMIFVLESALECFDHEKFHAVKKAIRDVIHLWQTDEKDQGKWSAAAAAADAADAAAAAYAADAAADAAAAAAAADAAAAAAVRWSAAARWSAADDARWSAADDARNKTYIKFADKLLELMRGCK